MLSLSLHFLSDKVVPLSPHTHRGLSSPSWFGFKSQRPCTPSLYLISAVSCKKGQRVGPRSAEAHTEVHLIQVQPKTNVHKKYSCLFSPAVSPGVFSFRPPLPFTERYFCNSMQASELCQKMLVSLKADPSFKVSVSLMGSTFPSAATRNEDSFTCM